MKKINLALAITLAIVVGVGIGFSINSSTAEAQSDRYGQFWKHPHRARHGKHRGHRRAKHMRMRLANKLGLTDFQIAIVDFLECAVRNQLKLEFEPLIWETSFRN